jgi:hypothetical protein
MLRVGKYDPSQQINSVPCTRELDILIPISGREWVIGPINRL